MMKKALAIIIVMFSFLGILTVQVHEEYDKDQLIRFHVLANSDSEADQALKLRVKDQVVSYMQAQFAHSTSIAESRAILTANLGQIQRVAQETLQAEDSPYDVRVQYGHFDFPIKYYGNFSLPAGNYEAVRVIIGEGAGQNWWCVLFPPMCFVDEGQAEPGLHQYSYLAPEKKVVLKWRLAQWWQKYFGNQQ